MQNPSDYQTYTRVRVEKLPDKLANTICLKIIEPVLPREGFDDEVERENNDIELNNSEDAERKDISEFRTINPS